jgi:hypothetical protein
MDHLNGGKRYSKSTSGLLDKMTVNTNRLHNTGIVNSYTYTLYKQMMKTLHRFASTQKQAYYH